MEIKAKCKFDYETIKALTRLAFAGKANPKTVLIAILAGALGAVVLCLLEVFFLPTRTFLTLTGGMIFIALIFLYFYFILPRIRYNALANLKDAESEYVFYDSFMKVSSSSPGLSGQSERQYSMFVKALETSKYFFIYQTKINVFVVDKSTVTDGTPEDIRNRLQAYLGARYYLCKY